MELLKEMIEMNKIDPKKFQKSVSKQLTAKLKGKMVDAFGPRGEGLWGEADEVQSFSINRVNVDYVDEDALADYPKTKEVFTSLDINLKGYNQDKFGLIYTDKVFLKDIKNAFKSIGINPNKIGYSEQGMQGDTDVNLDVKLKIADFI